MPCKDCTNAALCVAVCQLWLLPHTGCLGHGHVVARGDGAKARCGGPSICKVCQKEEAQLAGDTEYASWGETLATLGLLNSARAVLDAQPVPIANRKIWPPASELNRSGSSGPVGTCGAHRAGRPAAGAPLRGAGARSACGATRSVLGVGARPPAVLEEAMRLHDEAAEARRIFGKGVGSVPADEANRSRQTRTALREFLAKNLQREGER